MHHVSHNEIIFNSDKAKILLSCKELTKQKKKKSRLSQIKSISQSQSKSDQKSCLAPSTSQEHI